jgi:hypothetical protein
MNYRGLTHPKSLPAIREGLPGPVFGLAPLPCVRGKGGGNGVNGTSFKVHDSRYGAPMTVVCKGTARCAGPFPRGEVVRLCQCC